MNKRGPFKPNRKDIKKLVFLVIILVLGGLSVTDIPLNIEIGAIHLYQDHVSPVSSHFVTCRFNPT